MSVRECFEILPRASRLLDIIALLPRVLYHDAGVTELLAHGNRVAVNPVLGMHAPGVTPLPILSQVL